MAYRTQTFGTKPRSMMQPPVQQPQTGTVPPFVDQGPQPGMSPSFVDQGPAPQPGVMQPPVQQPGMMQPPVQQPGMMQPPGMMPPPFRGAMPQQAMNGFQRLGEQIDPNAFRQNILRPSGLPDGAKGNIMRALGNHFGGRWAQNSINPQIMR